MKVFSTVFFFSEDGCELYAGGVSLANTSPATHSKLYRNVEGKKKNVLPGFIVTMMLEGFVQYLDQDFFSCFFKKRPQSPQLSSSEREFQSQGHLLKKTLSPLVFSRL